MHQAPSAPSVPTTGAFGAFGAFGTYGSPCTRRLRRLQFVKRLRRLRCLRHLRSPLHQVPSAPTTGAFGAFGAFGTYRAPCTRRLRRQQQAPSARSRRFAPANSRFATGFFLAHRIHVFAPSAPWNRASKSVSKWPRESLRDSRNYIMALRAFKIVASRLCFFLGHTVYIMGAPCARRLRRL